MIYAKEQRPEIRGQRSEVRSREQESGLFTPGVAVLLFLVLIGAAFGAIRMIFGIGAVSNLSNQHPWGIWIGVDVASGVALASGGFTTAGLVYVLQRNLFHAVVRPALLTALLGYTFAVLALTIDIGRWWNIWQPMVHWNGTSVLFEVAICVMLYMSVLYLEFAPIVLKRFQGRVKLPGRFSPLNELLEALLDIAEMILGKIMPVLIVVGIVLSFLHQSSLGALMLIAPSKVHPLWYTPILPLLFLLSAIAVGFPMVVFESVAAARAFGHKTDREVLTELAKIMPFLIGLYLAVKIGDLAFRGAWVHLFAHTIQAKAFWVEMLIGVVLPFIMLLSPKVRRSPGWLFWASTIFVAGVLLNRVNVFWVSFQSPYQEGGYFPATGELAITVGFVAALILAYRIVVTFFPVLETRPHKLVPLLAILVLPFLAVDPGNAAERAEKVSAPMTPLVEKAATLIVLDSPIIRTLGDQYGPVKFMHRRHALLVGDCTVCHHRSPREPGDDYGSPASLEELEKTGVLPAACGKCHAQPWPEKQQHKPGLKGAYHQNCLGCHQESAQKSLNASTGFPKGISRESLSSGGRGPVDCRSCHAPHVPPHQELVQLRPGASMEEVTVACRSCHKKEAEAILKTSHWLWQGPSTQTVGYERRDDLGKRTWGMDNAWISAAANLQSCTRCHIGYGLKDKGFNFRDSRKVDCLACHDTSGKYRKEDLGSGFPKKGLDLVAIGKGVGRPGRQTCGVGCHFSGGKKDPLAHGGLSPALLSPDRKTDVHMAKEGADLFCQDCHRTRNHFIAGGGVEAIPKEGELSCSGCHSQRPHPKERALASHVNRHTEHLACQTCHIPVYARGTSLAVRWDWSGAAGDKRGRVESIPWGAKIGFASSIIPQYRWFNGNVKRVLAGDAVDATVPVELNPPQGEGRDPDSRIHPFWTRTGLQPLDKLFRTLLTPRWPPNPKDSPDWESALTEGMARSGLPYSGKFEFVETVTYHGVNHEVSPKKEALSCRDCHSALAEAPSCGRCHQPAPGWDFEALASGGRTAASASSRMRVDFKALGYAGDPVLYGGRFSRLPLAVPGKVPLPEK